MIRNLWRCKQADYHFNMFKPEWNEGELQECFVHWIIKIITILNNYL